MMADNNETRLTELRRLLNECDQGIVRSLGRRKQIVLEIGKQKELLGLDIEQPQYFRQCLQHRLEESEALQLREEFIRELFDLIHQQSIQDQISSRYDK